MKIVFFILILSLGLLAEEPPISGKVVATVTSTFSGGLMVDYTQHKKIHRGDLLSIEWGDGQYFTRVLSISHGVVQTDYTPTSVVVDVGATVRIVK